MRKAPGLRLLTGGLLGLAALAAVIATLVAGKSHQDSRPVVIATYLAFFAAAYVAQLGRAKPTWLGAMAVALAGVLPALVMSRLRLAMTDPLFLIIFVVTALCAVALALGVRGLKLRARPGLAIGTGGAGALAALAVAIGLVPQIVAMHAYETVDRQLAPFSVRTLDGTPVSSEAWHGRVVVLSYWATWCPPCLAELPQIDAFQRKYRDDPRVLILTINAGFAGDTAEKAKLFLQRRNLTGPTVIDDAQRAGEQHGQAALSLGLHVVPTLFILDGAGHLVAVHKGYDTDEPIVANLSERIDRLTARPRT